MRILTAYYRHRPGGMMQMLYRMLLAGAERGWDMHYVAADAFRVEHARIHRHLLPVPPSRSSLLFWAWFFLTAPLAILVVAWRRKVDLLAVFEGAYAWCALPAARLLRLPLVVFLQSDVATINRMHGRSAWLRRVEQRMERAGLRRADRIVATNRALANLISERWELPGREIVVLPNNVAAPSVERETARRRVREKLHMPEDAFVITTSGVFSPRKNLPLLLRAFAGVSAPRAHLVVIGEGPDPEMWRATMDSARKGANGERIHFAGWRTDVVEVLAGCDLFVFPTRHEGSPLSLIEALRSGLPCLGSDIAEIREVLGDEPECLFDPDDAPALAAQLQQAVQDEAFATRLRDIAARRAAEYDFDWEARVAQILEETRASFDLPRRDAIAVRVFEAVTGTRAAARTAAAVSRFAPYLLGMIVAKALSTLGQLFIARMLGPAEFGRLAVVLSTSTLLALPLAGAWGSTFVRYAAGQKENAWAPLLLRCGRRTLVSAAVGALLIIALSPLLVPLLQVPAALLGPGAALGLAMAAWLFAKAISQGRENWRRFVASEVAFGGVTLLLALALLYAAPTWWAAALIFAVAYAAGVLPAWRTVRTARSLRDDSDRTRGERRSAAHGNAEALPTAVLGTGSAGADRQYGRFALMTGTASALFLYGDRFAAQRVLGFEELGVYQLYSFATVGVAMLLSTLLYNFAFPLFPQGDRRAFAGLFRSGFVRLLPLTLAALFAAGWLQISLAGFPVRPGLLALATSSACAFLVSGFYGQLVLSFGVNGSQMSARVAATTLAVFALGVLPAVQLGGLAGLFVLYTGIYLGVAAFFAQALRRLAPEPAADFSVQVP